MYWILLVVGLAGFHATTSTTIFYRSSGFCWVTVSYVETYTDYGFWGNRKTKMRINHRGEEVCCDGYQRINDHTCSPICWPNCVNGICESPGQCSCIVNHKKKNNHVCVPICDVDCRHGTCVGVNICSCFKGYFVPLSGKSCEPFCSFPCNNGKCVKPDECECDKGYEWEPSSKKCKPICQLECINGNCTGVDECTCRENYSKSKTNWNVCEPICEPSCLNSFCIGYNNCSCFENYEKDEIKSNQCNPICKELCENAECTQPDTCVCNEGYRFSKNSSNVCEPICEPSCLNSFCSDYNHCSCFKDYEKDEIKSNQCNPICKEMCENAECTQPDVCVCNEGYRFSKNSRNVCEPVCENCVNGDCTAPEVCDCHEGYVRESEQCQPECYGCVNSLCVSPSNCECFPGFIKRNETFCADVCTDGNSTEDCVHIVEQLREHKLRRLDGDAVVLPQNALALSVDYSCRDFLDVCDTERCLTNATFECMAEKNQETIDLRCQRGTSDFKRSPNPHFNHTFNETLVNVNLTFIFPKEKSKGYCRLCFTEDFDVPIDRAEAKIITLIPCRDVSHVFISKSHASLVVITMTGFGLITIVGGAILIFYFKKRYFTGSLNLVSEEQLSDELLSVKLISIK